MRVYKDGNYYYTEDYDEYADSPRDYDHYSTFIGWHRNWGSPDANPFGNDMDSFDKEIRFNKDYICIPVYMYEHSSVALSLGSPEPWMDMWDTGLWGFIYANKEDIRKYYNVKRVTKAIVERVKECFSREIQEYGAYMNGHVYTLFKYEYNDGILEEVDCISGVYDVEEGFKDYFEVNVNDLEFEDVPNLYCLEHNIRAEELREKYCA